MLTVAFALPACAAPMPSTADAASDGRPVVLTTFTVLADIARNVGGEHLQILSITTPGAEIHGYEPTPGDIRRASDAALILDNGLDLEAWFAQFVASADAPHAVASDGVEPIPVALGEASGAPNPHAWMSPLNTQLYVDNMVAAFSDLDPAHAEDFAARGAAYNAELQQIHDEMLDGLSDVPVERRILVTCEGAFSYLARDAGLDEAYIWPVNADQQATPRRMAATIDTIRERDVPAVFCESTVSDRAMQQIVQSTDAVFGGVLYVDSLSAADGPVPTYLDLLRHDVDTIVAGLTGDAP